jgi:peptide deformylase
MPNTPQEAPIDFDQLTMVDPDDPVLNQIAGEVAPEAVRSSNIQGILRRMRTIAAGKGKSEKDSRQVVGLAAPQIGISRRITIVDTTASGALQEQTLEVFINPRIVDRSVELEDGREGCWSCNRVCGNVARAQEVTLEALDEMGKLVRRTFTGFVARIVQHEVDHLDGLRFPDRIPTDQPWRLHWVDHTEFDRYRQEWASWPHLCTRERWESVKASGE